jgi:cytosine/adenosine deaminase-related metal-dependent hydrolase
MNKDDIMRMAKESGAMFDHMTWVERDLAPVFYRFANLVAAAEREKVAQWMIEQGYATGHGDTVEDLLTELCWQVLEKEREACARVCEALLSMASSGDERQDGVTDCIDAILARGKK